MSKINLIIVLISLMMAMIDASTKADDVVALFKFLPSTQFNQLKPKIFGILNNSPLSKRPISKQAISITSDILNAFYSVTQSDIVAPKGRLRKRQDDTADEHQIAVRINDEHSDDPKDASRESSRRSKTFSDYDRSQHFVDASDSVKMYGFLDIFELSTCELQLIEEIMTGSNDELRK
jgi:hypothetical protein